MMTPQEERELIELEELERKSTPARSLPASFSPADRLDATDPRNSQGRRRGEAQAIRDSLQTLRRNTRRSAEQEQAIPYLENLLATTEAGLQPSGPQAAPGIGAATAPPVQAPPEASQAPQDGKPPPSSQGKLGSFGAGLGDAGIKAYLGLKQLTVGLNDEEKSVLKLMEEDAAADSGWRTAGDIAGNIALTALPGAAATRAASAATKGGTALAKTLAQVGAAGGTSGASEFLLTPTQGEGRDIEGKSINAAKAAALGAGFQAGGSALKKSVTGMFKPSPEAEALLKQGIVPKLQEGADSKIGRFVGGATSGIYDPKDIRTNKEVLTAFVKNLDPNIDTSKMTPTELLGTLKRTIDDEYKNVLSGKKFVMGRTQTDEIRKAAEREAGGRKATVDAVRAELDAILGTGKQNTRVFGYSEQSTKGLSRYREMFKERVSRLRSSDNVLDRDTADALEAAKAKFDANVRDVKLSPDELTRLKNNDAKYRGFIRVEDAANSPSGLKQITVEDLSRAHRKYEGKGPYTRDEYPQGNLIGPANRILGEGENQQQTRQALVAATRVAGMGKIGAGLGIAAAVPGAAVPMAGLYGLSALGQTRGGARALYGDFEKQKQLANMLRHVAPYGAGLGAVPSYEDED